MRVTSSLKCPGCTFDTRVGFKKPGAVGAEVFTFECGTCKSTVQIRAKRAKSGAIQYDAKNTRVSPALHILMKAEAEHNAKSVDEQGAQDPLAHPPGVP